MKFITYWSKEIFGEYEFEAENKEEAEKIVNNMGLNSNLNNDLDNYRNEGWICVDMDEVK